MQRGSFTERTRQIGIEKLRSEGRSVREVDIYILKVGCRHYYDGNIIAASNAIFHTPS